MKIYIVMGTTGEYSDRSEWVVKAFKSEDKAKELVEKASARAREIYTYFCNRNPLPGNELPSFSDEFYTVLWDTENASEELKAKFHNEFDPNFQLDSTGTNYHYTSVEFEDEV